MTAGKKQQEFLHTFRFLAFQIFTVMLMVRIKINTEIELSPLRRHNMATREFSDDFDAVAWHLERMSKPDYDEYYDEED